MTAGVQADETKTPVGEAGPVMVESHGTSMAVWDLPSPITITSKFRLKVGVGCSAGCKLSGGTVEVRDQEGRGSGDHDTGHPALARHRYPVLVGDRTHNPGRRGTLPMGGNIYQAAPGTPPRDGNLRP